MASILAFVRSPSFEPEHIRVMGDAYDRACIQLNGAASDPVKEDIARRIIDLATRGESDPDVLCDSAMRAVRP